MRKKYFLLISWIIFFCFYNSTYAITSVTNLNSGSTPTSLANTLVGSGVTISGITYVGNNAQAGTFTGLPANVGSFTSGVIFSSGNASAAIGPNTGNSSTSYAGAGDAQFNTLTAPSASKDTAFLQFSFTPQYDTIVIDYIFGSDEYNEYVGFGYTDSVGIFVNGVNCALLPGTNTPVQIDVINASTNSAYYVNNAANTYNVSMDGFTKELTCVAAVNAGVPNTLKIGVTDSFDDQVDTWAVFGANGINSYPRDFGDAPDTGAGTAKGNYKTLLSDAGANHVTRRLYLGSCSDGDTGTLQSSGATADDLNVGVIGKGTCIAGDDEDGVSGLGNLIQSTSTGITVTVGGSTGITGNNGYLNGWIDWNQDGDFLDANEQIFTDVATSIGANNLTINTPAGALGGPTYARFRLSTLNGGLVKSFGLYGDGEVEDYKVFVGNSTITNGTLPYVSSTNYTSYPVSGSCSFAGDNISITLSDGNTTTTSVVTPCSSTGSFLASVDTTTLTQGNISVVSTINNGFTTPVSDTDIVIKDTIVPVFSGATINSNNTNPLYAKTGDQITFTLEINPADTWATGNNLSFKIGSGSTITTGSFTSSTTPIDSRNRNYTVLAGDSGLISISAISFTDQAGNTLSGATLPYTPSPNVIVDNTAPVISFSDNVASGPVQSDTINISATDTYINNSTLEYGFSPDATCNASDTFGNSFTSGTEIVFSTEANNGNYICVKALDLAGNITYQISANPLNIDVTVPATPSCSSTPSPAADGQSVTTTCTGVETNAVVTIPNMSCTAESGGTVTCTGIVGSSGIVTSDDTVTVTDAAGNTNTSETTNLSLDSTPPNDPVVALDLQDASDTGTSNTDNITSDTTPSFDVVCTEVGSTITLYSGTGTIGAHTCSGIGVEGTTASPALSDGIYSITYTEADVSGNESGNSPLLSVTIDTVAPGIYGFNLSPSENISDTTPTISGTGEIGATITVTGPLGETCTATVDSIGNWSCDISPALAEGVNTLSFTTTDIAGNTSAVTNLSFIVDSITPLTPTIANPTSGLVTNDTTPTINGTGEAGTTFEILNGSGALVGTGVVDGSGNYSFTPTTYLPEGITTLTVTLTDAAGNTSPAVSVTFEVDVTAPTPLTLTTPIHSSITNDTTPTINGTGEAGTTFEILNGSGVLVGTGVVDGSGNYSFTPTTDLSEGINTLSVTLTDEAGNIAGPVSTTFMVDTIAPSDPVLALNLQDASDTGTSNTDNTTSDTTPSLDVVCTEVGSTITLYSGSTIIGTHTCSTVGMETLTTSTSMSDGDYSLTYTETDIAGNESGVSPSLSITIDSTIPALSAPAAVSVTNSSATITWQTSEATSTEVIYGLTTIMDETTGVLDISPRVVSHSATLSNLLSCTIYYYQTQSQDSSGNILIDGVHEFKTKGCVGNSEIIVSSTSSVVGNATGGNVALTQSGSNLVDIILPTGYNSSNAICSSGAYFQLKKLEKLPVELTLGIPKVQDKTVNAFELSAYCNPENRVTSFDTPITVKMSYTENDIQDIQENTIKIYRFNIPTNSWQELTNCSLDMAQNTVTCETTHFSTFSIFGQSKGAGGSYSSAGSGGGSSGSSSGGSKVAIITTNTSSGAPETTDSVLSEEEKVLIEQTNIELGNIIDSVGEDTIEKESLTGQKYILKNNLTSCPLIINIQDLNFQYPKSGIFTDETQSLYKDEVLKFAKLEIVNGYEDSSFQPKKEISRTEFLKVVLLSHCYEYQNQNTENLGFKDVDTTSWQARVIAKAQELGLINGDTDENGVSIFRPDDIISKAEAIKITMRMSMIQAVTPIELGYSDITTDWHIPYIQTGETLGLFNSESDNSLFGPELGVSRESMIDIIYRLIQLY